MMIPSHRHALCQVLLLAIASTVWAQAPGTRPAFQPIQDDPQLPRVLLLGDSISIGYTADVRQLLAGKANVHRAPENCGPTTRGLEKMDIWLGDGHWDLIHVNFGLHDLKYVDEAGQLATPDSGQQQVPPRQYEQNLRQLVRRLQQTGATLIWCSTTPVPEGASGRQPGDAEKYNQIAARVMRQLLGEDRVINDLYALAHPRLAEIQQPANVHFTAEGSRQLAVEVAEVITQALAPPSRPREEATGVVFHDVNSNGVFDKGDFPVPFVRVSNGCEIVTTNASGRYRLPLEPNGVIFVIKPHGFRTTLNELQLPQFYYLHKPTGSPPQRFPGVAATGPLPDSVDFPLYPQTEPSQFRAILFGDPQPRNQKEVDYMAHDMIEELVGTDASFGVTLGDITFDNLALFEPQAQAIAVLGIPWYNVIGNHDVNYDARNDRDSDESFERTFGPSYYAFDYGPVHFIVLDDVEWLIDEDGKGRYQGGLGRQQMQFVRRDLAALPAEQLVVLMMHIPLTDVRDRHELYRLIEQRPFCLSISAHAHHHEHRFIAHEDGWRGPEPHHHLINVTVSGSWWAGLADDRGIPHATMADGTPNGYSVISFDGQQYSLSFRAAGRPAEHQMQIHAPETISPDQVTDCDVFVNVFNGSERSTVQLRVGGDGDWVTLQRTIEEDPGYLQLYARESAQIKTLKEHGSGEIEPPVDLSRPKASTHLWRGKLPQPLAPGSHLLHVKTTDMHGQNFSAQRILRVTGPVPRPETELQQEPALSKSR